MLPINLIDSYTIGFRSINLDDASYRNSPGFDDATPRTFWTSSKHPFENQQKQTRYDRNQLDVVVRKHFYPIRFDIRIDVGLERKSKKSSYKRSWIEHTDRYWISWNTNARKWANRVCRWRSFRTLKCWDVREKRASCSFPPTGLTYHKRLLFHKVLETLIRCISDRRSLDTIWMNPFELNRAMNEWS